MTFLIVTELEGDALGGLRHDKTETVNAESLSEAICAVTDQLGGNRLYTIHQRGSHAVIDVAPAARAQRQLIRVDGT